jgi:hypothetical protein
MKAIILIIVITAVSFFSSCGDDSSTNSSMTSYKYTGFDSTGNKIIEGYLWIDSIDSVEVKGRWRFNLVSNCENMGPQIGKGNFEGTTDMWGHMLFNLNPGMIDNNVLLEGSMQLSYRIDGRWSYIGFPGVINWGSFKAEQLR